MKLCQEGWHRPALSLFAKVSLAFSCVLPKIACFQNFLLTPLDFCGNLSQRSIAIQLFNATATSLNCISQRCRFGQGRWQHPAAQRARKGLLSEPRHYQSSAGAGATRYPDRPSRPAEAVACRYSEKVHSYQKRSYPCTGCCHFGQKDLAWQLFADRRRIFPTEKPSRPRFYGGRGKPSAQTAVVRCTTKFYQLANPLP